MSKKKTLLCFIQIRVKSSKSVLLNTILSWRPSILIAIGVQVPYVQVFFKFNLKSLGPLCRLLHTKGAKFNFSDKRSKLNQVPPVPTKRIFPQGRELNKRLIALAKFSATLLYEALIFISNRRSTILFHGEKHLSSALLHLRAPHVFFCHRSSRKYES